MKKLLFLLTIGSLAFSAQAQENTSVILRPVGQPMAKPGKALSREQMDRMHAMPYCKQSSNPGARTTTTTHTDWYDLWGQNYSSTTSVGYYFETFPDSNLYDASSTSYIFWHGLGQSFDPTDSGYFSTTFNGGTLVSPVSVPLPETNSGFPATNPNYTIDSIYVPVQYMRYDNTVTDSLIIEITEAVNNTSVDTGTYNLEYPSSAGITWWSADQKPRFGTVHYNPGLASDPAPYNAAPYINDAYFDTVFMAKQRYAFALTAATAADTDANGMLLLGALPYNASHGGGMGGATTLAGIGPYSGLYSFPLPSPIVVNTQTGMNPHVCTFVSFKSGHAGGTYAHGTAITAANWIKLFAGSPSGTSFFMQASSNPASNYVGSYQAALYAQNQIRYSDTGFTFPHGDHNVLVPSVAYGSAPTGGTAYQLAVQESAFHITWTDNPTTKIINVNSLQDIKVYPNPANSSLNITYNAAQNTVATVSLTNMVGQVVASQTVSNGIATFNTSSLPAGVYIYTLEANGNRQTGRVVIGH
jgi:Secretion system C-terminal sorting domain